MMCHSLKSSLRDDSNECNIMGFGLRKKKVSILKTLYFRPYLLPCLTYGVTALKGISWKILTLHEGNRFVISMNSLTVDPDQSAPGSC